MITSLLFLITSLLQGAIPTPKIPFTLDVTVPAAIDGSSIDYQFFIDGADKPEPCLELPKVLNPQSAHPLVDLHLMCKLEPGKHVGVLRLKIHGYDPFTVNVGGIDVRGLLVNSSLGVIDAPPSNSTQVPVQVTAEPVQPDVPLETSQIPVQARVSSEPVRMKAAEHPEGILHIDVAATDSKGKPVSGLAVRDFTLTDNGVPQQIVSFAASDPTLLQNERLSEVALVLDEVDLLPNQLEILENESMKFLRQNGGHLAEPTSVYWFTMSGLYATNLTTDGNALAEDVAHHTPHRKVLAISQSYDPFVSRTESERLARWNASVRAVYSMAIERRDAPGRKLLLWMGFGWLAINGNQHYKDEAFPWLVELSTRIREARMVISEVTVRTQPDGSVAAGGEPTAFAFKNSYKDYLGGVRTPSELEAQGFGPSSRFALPVLAIQSGGLVVDQFLDISRSIEYCVEDAREFYTVSFDPPFATHPDEYHDLAVHVDAPDYRHVRTVAITISPTSTISPLCRPGR